MPNRLEKELSPYLIQHRNNPVDWYPWGEEAFEKAAKEDRPIFLSIGYATCHWCHVMEHESFEDEEVAALMNDTFVSIKVDREERPDIDRVYMTYCQLSTGQGGWPLTIVMTPDRQPFFSATYLPKQSRFGRVGMMDLVPRVKHIWENQREEVIASAVQNVQALNGNVWAVSEEGPAPGVLDFACQQLADSYDPEYGGFGEAPKFPSPHQLQFLVRYALRSGNGEALEMACNTLLQMRRGGIFDHVGFGFHRYSTDRRWLLPHFEKMLYDQAMIALAAVDAFEAAGDDAFEEIADKIFAYVLRDMTDVAGGFYSAEDADSEGEEGKFYVWTVEEINRTLETEAAHLFCDVFNIEPAGNFREESTGELTGANIPHLRSSLEEAAGSSGLAPDVFAGTIEAARQTLFEIREQRVHPEKDDKILTDWNGLMIAALSRAAQAFDSAEYATAAKKAADFVDQHLTQENGRLWHRYRAGVAGLQANLDDYAFMVHGLLALYEATFEEDYLARAIGLNKYMMDRFWDGDQGGFFFTPDDGEQLIARQKEAYDGAAPSGNSVALSNLLRIGRITAEPVYEEMADGLMRAFGNVVNRHPSGFCAMLAGVGFAMGPALEIVVVGPREDDATQMLIRTIREARIFDKVVLLKDDRSAPALSEIAPYTESMKALNGAPTVYVCENYQCNQPVTDAASLRELLNSER